MNAMARVRATVVWTLERLRTQVSSDKASSMLMASIVRTWGHEIGLMEHGVILYTRTYDDDTSMSVLSIPGGVSS